MLLELCWYLLLYLCVHSCYITFFVFSYCNSFAQPHLNYLNNACLVCALNVVQDSGCSTCLTGICGGVIILKECVAFI